MAGQKELKPEGEQDGAPRCAVRVPHGPGRRTGPGIECRGQEGGSVEGARGGLQREEREEGSPPPGSGDRHTGRSADTAS